MYGRIRVSGALGAVVVSMALTLTGCGSSPNAGAPATSSPARSFTVATPHGSVSVSLDGKLPPAWPAAFPVPKGATAAGSGSVGGSTTSHMVAVFKTDTSGQDTFNFYKTSSSLGVSGARSVGAGSSFVGQLRLSGSYSGSVTVLDHAGQTLIVIYLETGAGTTTTTAAGGS